MNLRMTTVITAAVFFLAVGTFTSVTVQGAYQVLIAVPMVYYAWRAKGRNFRLPASAWFLLAFSAVALLSICLNWDIIPRPGKNLGKVKYYLMAAFGIFPFSVWLNGVSDRTKTRLVRSLAVAVAVAGFWCGWQVLWQGEWKAQPLTETMRYAYGSSMLMLLWLAFFLQRGRFGSWLPASWSILGMVGIVVGVIFTQGRGPQVALICCIPWVVFFWNRKWGTVALLTGVLAGGAVALNYIYGSDTETTIRLMRSTGNNSDNIRRSQWQSAFIAWKEKPWLGWGHGNFHTQVERIKIEHDLFAKKYVDAHAHNVPLEIAAGTGAIGLFFFLGWFLTWMWECWRAGGWIRSLMVPFFMAIIFEAQFEVILDANNATWISFLYAMTFAWDKRYLQVV